MTRLAFAADSQCPGFPDESEGDHQDTSAMRVMTVVPDLAKVPDQNAPASCLTTPTSPCNSRARSSTRAASA
ncbi:MAG: hypothetical protein U1F43_25795 [Myxococcota bacterium]